MRAEELMAKPPATCEPEDTLLEAAQAMWGSNCGCLPVIAGDGSQRLVGMITDRDIYMAALSGGRIDERILSERQVKSAMATQVRACRRQDGFVEVGDIMQGAQLPLLPVVDESQRVVGVISLAEMPPARAASPDPRSNGRAREVF